MELEYKMALAELNVEKREDESRFIRGHAAVFNQIESGGWYREQVAPGAFKNSLKQDDIRALWNHKTEFVLGRNKAGTLSLKEDDTGLYVEINPPDTQIGRDAIVSIDRGDVSQMSFGFIVKKATWTEFEDEDDLRTIEDVELWEVSPVTFPFYPQTDVSVKAEYRAWQDSQPKPAIYKSKILRRKLILNQRQNIVM